MRTCADDDARLTCPSERQVQRGNWQFLRHRKKRRCVREEAHCFGTTRPPLTSRVARVDRQAAAGRPVDDLHAPAAAAAARSAPAEIPARARIASEDAQCAIVSSHVSHWVQLSSQITLTTCVLNCQGQFLRAAGSRNAAVENHGHAHTVHGEIRPPPGQGKTTRKGRLTCSKTVPFSSKTPPLLAVLPQVRGLWTNRAAGNLCFGWSCGSEIRPRP